MKAAIITGAIGGIGQALCEEFTKAGYAVIATDRRVGQPVCHKFVQLDIRDLCRTDVERADIRTRLLAALDGQPLAALVNNAAVQVLGSTERVTVGDWQETLEINLLAPFFLAQVLLPELTSAGGSVVNIASVHAVATKPEFIAYSTSKAALVGLTRSMAVDLGARVRVNALLPAAVNTPMLAAGFAGNGAGLAALGAVHPLGRIAQTAEVAKTAVFLASEQASFISGAALLVDGGIAGRLHDPA